MRSHATFEVLTVLDADSSLLRIDVLPYTAIQCNGHDLNAAADTQHGNLPVEGHPDKQQFHGIAAGIDAMQGRYRVFTAVEGIEVGTSRKQQSIYGVQHRTNGIGTRQRGNDEGHGPSLPYRTVIGLCQFTSLITKIARDTYHGLSVPCWERVMPLFVCLFPVKLHEGTQSLIFCQSSSIEGAFSLC